MSATPAALELLNLAAITADDALGEDLVAIDVSSQLYLADCFLLVTADNQRHSRSIVDAISRAAREKLRRRPDVIEGGGESGWVVIDYGDLVVHVLSEEDREFYALEKLWSQSPRIELTLPQRPAPIAD